MTLTTIENDQTFGLYTVGEPIQDTKAPDVPIDEMWTVRKFEASLVNPPVALRQPPSVSRATT